MIIKIKVFIRFPKIELKLNSKNVLRIYGFKPSEMELIRGVQENFRKEGRIKIVTQVQVRQLNNSLSYPFFSL